MKILKGMIVKTNYGTGPYVITEVEGLCTCPKYLDLINMTNPPDSKPHYHYVCKKDGEYGNYYLGGFDESMKNVWDDDYLIIVSTNCAQLSLF